MSMKRLLSMWMALIMVVCLLPVRPVQASGEGDEQNAGTAEETSLTAGTETDGESGTPDTPVEADPSFDNQDGEMSNETETDGAEEPALPSGGGDDASAEPEQTDSEEMVPEPGAVGGEAIFEPEGTGDVSSMLSRIALPSSFLRLRAMPLLFML